MTRAEQALLAEAQATYKEIFPCGSKQSLNDCFTSHQDRIMFWFNTSDSSTHLLMARETSSE